MSINLKQLVGKLNDTCKRTLEGAAGLCLSRTNYNVEIEHWLLKLLETQDADVHPILKAFEIEPARLMADLTRAVDALKTGNARPPALSKNVVDLIREGWLIASVEFMEPCVRSGHLIYVLASDDGLQRLIGGSTSEFHKINAETLKASFHVITADSDEASQSAMTGADQAAQTARVPGRPAGLTKTPALDQYTNDLTAQAQRGDLDPVLGRDSEIRQVMDILCRRRQNNPLLVGEPGVGKTAVAEGFALRIAAGDVPASLRNVSLRALDLGLLQAGAGVKG
ncbi:MAG: type VI secretion system ATPase TssH, partial [Planctomycetaceae bacterium]|nr:type VI secretion system ATPase TssH [Planctomycetaceae bacterium]